jgi:cell division protein FtsA
MKNSSLKLYLEINNSSFIFLVGESNENENFKIAYKLEIPLQGIENSRITNLEKVTDVIKKNIYIIEQELNHTFKEVVLILENFELTFINLSGFKKLNGSQILRENITYILNNLKSYIDKTESKKTILHIFNSKFYLDNKKVENLPIGLFGDFYSHELSFTLINSNDEKNLKAIFHNCNLKIKKMFIKSFLKGVNISDSFKNKETFFQIKISERNSKIFYFENNSLKFEQNFAFGTDIIINDISKVTSLKTDTVKIILNKIDLRNNISENELIKKELFESDVFRKIKEKLIYNIASARIKEIIELMLTKNVNFLNYNKVSNDVFFEIDTKSQLINLEGIFERIFSMYGNYNLIPIKSLTSENLINIVNNLVHFGWKKEAIPVLQVKKSVFARFFDKIFS